MEALSRLVAKAEEVGLVQGWKINQVCPSISMIQFTDDTLLFMQPEVEQMKYLWGILLLLEAASGLKINLNKSKIIGVGGG